jgi:hypothetical protein
MKLNKKSPRDIEDNQYDDMYDDDYIERSYNEQCYIDRLNYAQELYETGRIDEIQRAELRMGA